MGRVGEAGYIFRVILSGGRHPGSFALAGAGTCVGDCKHRGRFGILSKLSTVAWIAHNAGLGANFGGVLFGKAALNPKLGVIEAESERGKVLNAVWNRYNAINAASFATAAATWFPGRLGLSGAEIDDETRKLVLAKDVLFGAGALIGGASIAQGLALTSQAADGAVPVSTGTTPSSGTPEKAASLLKSINLLGNANLAVTGGLIGVTSVLAMKASESAYFSAVSRFLP